LDSRSFISSFRGFPWAGTLALAAVFAVDTCVLGLHGPWATINQLIPGRHILEWGIAQDRQQLARLLDRPPMQRRAIVVGSSRANEGFRPDNIDRTKYPEVSFGKIAHGFIGCFEIRSMVEEILGVAPDVVIIAISEFELNRPLYVVPKASFRSFSAIRDLIEEVGAASVFEQRLIFYRLTLASVLNSYRYRQVFHRAFADKLRRFQLDQRLVSAPSPGLPPHYMWDGMATPLTESEMSSILARLGEQFPHMPEGDRGVGQIRVIARGPHAAVARDLLRRAVERLSKAGVSVVIAEAPLHPITEEIYDTAIRTEFLAFADSLVNDFAVRVIPLEVSGPFIAGDFADLTHLNDGGATKLTQAIVSAVYEVLHLDARLSARAPVQQGAQADR